jgi:hypothetical protein
LGLSGGIEHFKEARPDRIERLILPERVGFKEARPAGTNEYKLIFF